MESSTFSPNWDIREQILVNARSLWHMIERERDMTGRGPPPRNPPRDMQVVLLSKGRRCHAVIVYAGPDENGVMGPLLVFAQGSKAWSGSSAYSSLLGVTQGRLQELSEAHMLRPAGTKFVPCKAQSNSWSASGASGTYE